LFLNAWNPLILQGSEKLWTNFFGLFPPEKESQRSSKEKPINPYFKPLYRRFFSFLALPFLIACFPFSCFFIGSYMQETKKPCFFGCFLIIFSKQETKKRQR